MKQIVGKCHLLFFELTENKFVFKERVNAGVNFFEATSGNTKKNLPLSNAAVLRLQLAKFL